MKKSNLAAIIFLLLAICRTDAAQEGPYTYQIVGSEIYITSYSGRTLSGTAFIPASINGMPVTRIGGFHDSSMQEISLPSTLKTIDPNTFENCFYLWNAPLPSGLRTIGNSAFKACNLGTMVIPKSVDTIGYGPFEYCGNLISILVDQENAKYIGIRGSLYERIAPGANAKTLIQYPGGIEEFNPIAEGVTKIGAFAFASHYRLYDINIPNTITEIEEGAFYKCFLLSKIRFQTSAFGNVSSGSKVGQRAFSKIPLITELEFPPGYSSIGHSAFMDCGKLSRVTLPYSVQSIGGSAFSGTIIETFELPSEVREVRCFEGCSRLKSMNMPYAQTLRNGAFYNCSSLTHVYIGENVTRIGDFLNDELVPAGVFEGCTNLQQITIPSKVTYFGRRTFLYCDSLVSVYFPDSVATMGDDILSTCKNLVSVRLPKNLRTIPQGAFSECSKLQVITIPSTVLSIGSGAFRKTALLGIQLPVGLTGFGERVFENCANLERITLPPLIQYLHLGTFKDCVKLQSVKLPLALTHIYRDCFLGCIALESIVLPSGLSFLDANVFVGCLSLRSVAFLGNAPSNIATGTVFPTNADFKVICFSGTSGFTQPTWKGALIVQVDRIRYPASPWLLQNNLVYDTNLHESTIDGTMPLLMAYALNAELGSAAETFMPQLSNTSSNLELSFNAGSPGISYIVEASPDMVNWSSEGVILSPIGSDKKINGSITLTGPARFLRLKVHD